MNRLVFAITEPEFKRIYSGTTSKGNQMKYTNGKVWLKANYLGYENIAECFVSDLLNHSTIDRGSYVRYNLCHFYLVDRSLDIYDGCVSENFLGVDDELIVLGRLLEKYGVTQKSLDDLKSIEERIELVVGLIKHLTGLDLRNMLYTLATLDAVILNEDRHLFNIAIIYNRASGYRLCPIFDNGLSLLSDTQEYSMYTPTSVLIRNVKCKPFSTDFKKQYKAFNMEPVLKFYKSDVENLLKIYNNTRISAVINHSITKYPELFI